MSEAIVSVSPAAVDHIRRVMADQSWTTHGLRFGLRDGGCSGYTYLLEFEPAPTPEDVVCEQDGVRVFVHPMHVPFVIGSTIHFKQDRFESGFDVENPNAKRFCGCGESFDVG